MLSLPCPHSSMLNSDALQQLSKLKQNIQASKEYAEGLVRGTANRFGFVVLDDGREAFLPPDEMQQVLPGDRVKVSLTENDKKKHEAKLEKLISSELKEFVGNYVVKGNNHFVSADHPQLSRWLFVPPKERKNMKNGDLVRCSIARHPFGDGKAQVKILARIGRPEDIGIERLYMIHKHSLPSEWSAEALQQVQDIKAQAAKLSSENREDLTALPFVTIDSESTLDMDDALYAELREDGSWQLYTAIADPSSLIPVDSPLDVAARERASSVYFPGASLSMLPSELSQDGFSLLAGANRPALVCKQHISQDGEIIDFSFIHATIASQHKLSYSQVADLLENGNSEAVPEQCRDLLSQLYALAQARRDYRSKNHLTQADNWDYIYRLNKQQKIERIERRQPTLAHQVVEEAMLATNCCAGAFLAQAVAEQSDVGGLFASHAGFRDERRAEIEQLLKKDKPELADRNLQNLEDFRHVIQHLQQDEADSVLLATLKRRLQPAAVSATVEPHFGLGIESYATITSPIRRYQDLHNHRVIKALLSQASNAGSSVELAEQLQQQLQRNRQACRQTEHWLLCQFLAGQKGQEFEATVVAVASQGILVRLVESGAEGFIPLRGTKQEPAKYDSLRMTLNHQGETYHLEQKLTVTLDKVDLTEKQLQLSLSRNKDKAE